MNVLNADYHCSKCNRQVTVNENQKISYRESCLGCRQDLHICKNCHFYDPSMNNECLENQAEKVTDKEKNNRCEFFRFKSGARVANNPQVNAKKMLEDLFK